MLDGQRLHHERAAVLTPHEPSLQLRDESCQGWTCSPRCCENCKSIDHGWLQEVERRAQSERSSGCSWIQWEWKVKRIIGELIKRIEGWVQKHKWERSKTKQRKQLLSQKTARDWGRNKAFLASEAKDHWGVDWDPEESAVVEEGVGEGCWCFRGFTKVNWASWARNQIGNRYFVAKVEID